MLDREKVINGLECCSQEIKCGFCPYWNDDTEGFACSTNLAKDALALLKEQEEEIENLKQTAQSMMEGVCLLKEQEAEKENIPEYPCKNCCNHSERAACCGCEKERQWQTKYGKRSVTQEGR